MLTAPAQAEASESEPPPAAPLTAGEGDPAGVLGGLPAPVRRHQESTGDRQGDDAHDDEEERGDPLGGQPRRDTGAVSSVDGLTLPDQPHRQGACRREDAVRENSSFPVREPTLESPVGVLGGTSFRQRLQREGTVFI